MRQPDRVDLLELKRKKTSPLRIHKYYLNLTSFGSLLNMFDIPLSFVVWLLVVLLQAVVHYGIIGPNRQHYYRSCSFDANASGEEGEYSEDNSSGNEGEEERRNSSLLDDSADSTNAAAHEISTSTVNDDSCDDGESISVNAINGDGEDLIIRTPADEIGESSVATADDETRNDYADDDKWRYELIKTYYSSSQPQHSYYCYNSYLNSIDDDSSSVRVVPEKQQHQDTRTRSLCDVGDEPQAHTQTTDSSVRRRKKVAFRLEQQNEGQEQKHGYESTDLGDYSASINRYEPPLWHSSNNFHYSSVPAQ